ncbi:sensor kinase/phosphatase LuxQ [Seminavis robusta]|uniref:histidine kinase n=1 Tax=Seminavis robusta TaxID=568900 RepID=A0A9N8H7N5_9STRA|nr:sensor kinase/phosphatase LuxQ [Seminavis robusta]|eukprot:Sro134_g063450.1 sensor kinase/phosphatase LuxQ (885) ;mRNA; r:50591-53917
MDSSTKMTSLSTVTTKTAITTNNTNGNSTNIHDDSAFDAAEKGQVNTMILPDTTTQQQQHSSPPAWAKNSSNTNQSIMAKRRTMFTALIVLVGAIASVAFYSMGIVSVKREQESLFERRATDITKSIQNAWNQYEVFGLWIQESCFSPLSETNHDTIAGRMGLCSREKFALLIESVNSRGLEFKAVGMIPNVTDDNRAGLEEESRAYYAEHYPKVDYNGFVGFVPNEETGGLKVASMVQEPSYWPVHYMEPVAGNEAALDLDLYSHPARQQAIDRAVATWKPIVTNRIRLAQETEPNAYSVLSYNPGVKYASMAENAKPTVLSSIAVRVPDLLQEAAQDASVSISVTIYDSTDDSTNPTFMGGADIYVHENGTVALDFVADIDLVTLQEAATRFEELDIQVADRTWVVAVTAQPGTFQDNLVFVILGGTMIFIASILLAIWFYTNMGRMLQMQKMKASMESEKARIILETARQQARAERQLNEYIAHEVRNPLCSAITALSFVSAATKETESTEDTRHRLREDVAIVDASLQFINELLRNMLDMHRAADKQMKITKAPTDLRQDVLQPVAAILHLRGSKVKVQLECPHNLVCNTDRMRLKQVVLNLSINATKFVTQGFIRLRAEVPEGGGNVRIYVEDSGPGIPQEKRGRLFQKFQESLDLLNQGTGIGLCLCKHLSCLLGGDIWLDESFDTGIEGCPGTRFIIDMGSGPMETPDDAHDATGEESSPQQSSRHLTDEEAPSITDAENLAQEEPEPVQLPNELRVLFVDDDLIIRRLFMRAIKRIAAGWHVEEASNGETALHMCKSNEYDIIFIDQYMASVEKQLLGTETVRALRAQGVEARICGLSANDMEEGFLENGANSFLFKPFPCEKDAFSRELARILRD